MASILPGSKNVRTWDFKLMLEKLPDSIQQLATKSFDQFKANPNHPSLCLHLLQDKKKSSHKNGTYAVSITKRYRALFVITDDTNVWYWIGTHEAYNNYTGK